MITDLKPYAEYKESGLPWLKQMPQLPALGRTHQGREVTHRTGSACCSQPEIHPPTLPILNAAFNMRLFRLYTPRSLS